MTSSLCSSMFILSSLARTFECYGSLLWTVASSRNVYDFSYVQKTVVWLRVPHQHVFSFIVLKAKMACSCSLKAKADSKSCSWTELFSSFGEKKHVVWHTDGTGIALVSIYSVSIKYKLRTADCGLYRYKTERGLNITDWIYKTNTQV